MNQRTGTLIDPGMALKSSIGWDSNSLPLDQFQIWIKCNTNPETGFDRTLHSRGVDPFCQSRLSSGCSGKSVPSAGRNRICRGHECRKIEVKRRRGCLLSRPTAERQQGSYWWSKKLKHFRIKKTFFAIVKCSSFFEQYVVFVQRWSSILTLVFSMATADR